MRKLMIATGAALALATATAHAEQAEGTIEQVDKVQGTIMVNGDLYRVMDEGTAGATIEDLKEGDEVTIQYKLEGAGQEDRYYNALQVDKVE